MSAATRPKATVRIGSCGAVNGRRWRCSCSSFVPGLPVGAYPCCACGHTQQIHAAVEVPS